MKNQTQHTQKLKQLLARLKKQASPPPKPPGDREPLDLLILAIMHPNASAEQAYEAVGRLRTEFVDFNEMRVAPPRDIEEILGRNLPELRAKAELLPTALNRVFDHGNDLSLEYLRAMAPAERRAHVREALGLGSFGEAMLEMLLFDEPAIPVDDRLLAKLKAEGCVSDSATVDDARQALEALVADKDSHNVFDILSAWAAEPIEPAEPPAEPKTAAAKTTKAKTRKAAKATKSAKPPPAAKKASATRKTSGGGKAK